MADGTEPKKITFEHEGEAVAFKEGIEAAAELYGMEERITTDAYVDDDRWTVEYSLVVV